MGSILGKQKKERRSKMSKEMLHGYNSQETAYMANIKIYQLFKDDDCKGEFRSEKVK
jgi:hypothetical protein